MSDYKQGYDEGFTQGVESVEERMSEAAAALSDNAAYRIARMAGSVHPCQVEGGCSLSQEEHHRLSYGVLNENRELKRRIEALENGRAEIDA